MRVPKLNSSKRLKALCEVVREVFKPVSKAGGTYRKTHACNGEVSSE